MKRYFNFFVDANRSFILHLPLCHLTSGSSQLTYTFRFLMQLLPVRRLKRIGFSGAGFRFHPSAFQGIAVLSFSTKRHCIFPPIFT